MESASSERRRTFGRSETGEGRIGCIFWSLVLIVGGVIAWTLVPVQVRTSEFIDYMDDQAQFASQRSGEAIKKRLLDKANDLRLPVGPKELSVAKEGERVKMHVEFTIVVEFPFGFTYDWDVEHDVDRPIFYY